MDSETTPAAGRTDDPISMHLVQCIRADPRETGVVVVGKLAMSRTRRGALLAEGMLGKAEIGHGIVSWPGVLPGSVSAGGFEADKLVVQDDLVLTLNAPGVQMCLILRSAASDDTSGDGKTRRHGKARAPA